MKTKRLSLILVLAFLIITALSSVGVYATWQYAGHASLQHDVQIETADSPIYISDAEFVDGGGGALLIIGYIECNFVTKATLAETSASTVTAKITVRNDTSETYAFNAVKYRAEEYDNADIEVKPDISHGTEVASGASLTFNAVYGYKKGVKPSNTVLNSTVLFEFMPLDELPEEEVIAVDGALAQFKNIINDVNQNGSFDKLIEQMNKNGDNDRHDDSYIGNVGGASENDVTLLEELFQGNLTLNIDGVDTEVTILIKREDLDGNSATGDEQGREMAIYMTTDDLKRDSWWGSSTAVVYVSVFTSNNGGEEWHQIGTMYEGKATIKGYDGNIFGDGSFDTDTWKSNENRTIESIIKG